MRHVKEQTFIQFGLMENIHLEKFFFILMKTRHTPQRDDKITNYFSGM